MMPFRIVSYFTLNTGYAEVAKRLIVSLESFNLPYEVKGIANRGNWQQNTMYKAFFIKEMLQKYPETSIIFLDADAVVRQRPVLFETIDSDLGLCFRDYSKFPCSQHKSGKELLSGTIYFANNERSMMIIDQWIEKNQRMSFRWEQKNLAEIIELNAGKVSITEFPPTYCQIFDIMRAAGQPVIIQMQVSRQLKQRVNMGVR